MKKNYLLTPGPTPLPPEVLNALSRPIIHHRTPQFLAILKEAIEGLKYVFQTQNDILLFTASGTGAMEAAVSNLLSPGDKAICIQGGKFGERWTELCKSYKIDPIVIDVEWGKAVQSSQIEEALSKDSSIKAVFTTLCETSTGVVMDIKSIAGYVKNTNAVLVVDAISGLGADDCQTDNWGIDVVVCGSQKGLMLPPGLAFCSVSKKAWDLVEKSQSPKFYFDFKSYRKSWQKQDLPFTSSIPLIIALNESLKLMKKEGLQNLFKRCSSLAQTTKNSCKALGLELFADRSCASCAVTSVKVPEAVDGGKLVKIMRDEYGVTIAGGQTHLKGKIFRIAHMGYINKSDIIEAISCLEEVLGKLGYKFPQGAGVKTARGG